MRTSPLPCEGCCAVRRRAQRRDASVVLRGRSTSTRGRECAVLRKLAKREVRGRRLPGQTQGSSPRDVVKSLSGAKTRREGSCSRDIRNSFSIWISRASYEYQCHALLRPVRPRSLVPLLPDGLRAEAFARGRDHLFGGSHGLCGSSPSSLHILRTNLAMRFAVAPRDASAPFS
jgi:hypothetical protein